ncbi:MULTISPECIES: 50S ribosomal protein L29 [Acidianus]|uniref:Large ribosomal subunit protein uL29 n=1 Tax=Candidatus Acidianus copahuensis TaxID=1160895 RepID=A0A031LMF1_9CREN|nr:MULTISPECIES: 50S ribosomal protein L29 [Acidianus]EZQ03856.1 50S ribosomal protein L29 [Candidatus Acidianus copahuensis]NON62513.1 50S ribosomal protein L29 [Acidianus sp. RZ1]
MPLNNKELSQMSLDQLNEKLRELQLDLLKYRADSRLGTLKNTSIIKNTRKDIARIMTTIAQKSRENKSSNIKKPKSNENS